jgi:hypothetical protein
MSMSKSEQAKLILDNRELIMSLSDKVIEMVMKEVTNNSRYPTEEQKQISMLCCSFAEFKIKDDATVKLRRSMN